MKSGLKLGQELSRGACCPPFSADRLLAFLGAENKILFGTFLLCCVIVPSLQRSPPVDNGHSECRYWCKNDRSQFYCCENSDDRPGPVGEKKGRCPQVRPSCPGLGATFSGPKTCSNDYSCPGRDKCCYDVCLKVKCL
ncbi:hypothetical protein Avbf_14315 [Armadillidium vulgare]|nr:hypothetical protein Avbf_14315 [Armadillidium vulgare]